MNTLTDKIISCYKHIPYTAKHWVAFQKISIQYIHFPLFIFHDVIKLCMFILFPFLGEECINYLHRKYNLHHFTYWEGDTLIKKDLSKYPKWLRTLMILETIIDWECARFTKPDKPLNARDTLFKYYPEYVDYVLPVLNQLCL